MKLTVKKFGLKLILVWSWFCWELDNGKFNKYRAENKVSRIQHTVPQFLLKNVLCKIRNKNVQFEKYRTKLSGLNDSFLIIGSRKY